MAYGYTNAQALLKVVYDTEEIRNLIPEHVAIWNKFQKWDEPAAPGGKYFEFPVTISNPGSTGWMQFSGATRTPANPGTINGQVYPRQVATTLSIEHALMKLSETQVQSFEKALDYLKEGHMARLRRARVLAIYGNRLGIQAYTNGGIVATATIPVNGMYGFTKGDNTTNVTQGAEVFNNPGESIVIDPAGISGGPFYRVIVSNDPVAGTITVGPGYSGGPSVVTTGAGIPICFGEGTADTVQSGKMDRNASFNCPDGFCNIFDNATYLGIDPATYSRWRSLRFSGDTPGTVEPLDSKHINQLLLGTQVNSGCDINLLCMNTGIVQEFVALYEQQIKYDPQEFKGGMREVTWDLLGKKVTLFYDPAAPHNCIMGFTEKELAKFIADEGDWLAEDGAMFKLVQGTTSYLAVWAEIWNIGTRNRRAHAIQKDIEESTNLFQ